MTPAIALEITATTAGVVTSMCHGETLDVTSTAPKVRAMPSGSRLWPVTKSSSMPGDSRV